MLVGALVGATASGKSAIALAMAKRNGWALLNADSRQWVRGMRIGTAGPSEADMQEVPHFLFGECEPTAEMSPQRYREAALQSLAKSDRPMLAVGGSGLYLKELLQPNTRLRGEVPEAFRAEAEARLKREGGPAIHAWLCERDPDSMAKVHPSDGYRLAKRLEHYLWLGESYAQPPPGRDPHFAESLVVHVTRPRDELHGRIAARLEQMWSAGWKEEVAELKRTVHMTASAWSAVGYREIAEALENPISDAELMSLILARTRQYAKKQIAFFKSQMEGAVPMDAQALTLLAESVDWRWSDLKVHLAGKAP
jgi:tRNA dimethylallyltransferase